MGARRGRGEVLRRVYPLHTRSEVFGSGFLVELLKVIDIIAVVSPPWGLDIK